MFGTSIGLAAPCRFTLDPSGRRLRVANEPTDTVVTFAVDTATGRPTPTGPVVATSSPTRVAFETSDA